MIDLARVATCHAVFSRADGRITASGIVGSHARGATRPGSDIDVMLLAPEPALLLADMTWTKAFGEWRSLRERCGLVTSLRCHYAVRPEIEFGIASPIWCRPPID